MREGLASRSSHRLGLWVWWLGYALVVAFIVLPGPDRTPFSGLPLSLKAQALAIALALVGLFTVLFRPTSRPGRRWLLVLIAAVALKLVLSSFLVSEGWKGTYLWVQTWRAAETRLIPMEFYQHQRIRTYRLDRGLQFTMNSFALHFINQKPGGDSEYAKLPRHQEYPLQVRWRGSLQRTEPLDARVTANGNVTVEVSGRRIFHAENPRDAAVVIPIASPNDVVQITYSKPARIEPGISVSGFEGEVVTPAPAAPAAIARSRQAFLAIQLLGVLALSTLAWMFVQAYKPVTTLFLETIWERPSKVAALAFVAFFLLVGFVRSVPYRSTTVHLTHGDDFLTYATNAREILYNGILMVPRESAGGPYYHYPLYPYLLAGAHFVFGEDFSTIVFFNFACIASLGLLFWVILKRRIAEGASIAILLILAFLGYVHFARYAMNAYSDNLYLPVVFATLALLIRAYEHPSASKFLGVGILTALGAATRPSFLLFVPVAGLGILLEKRLGSFFRRVWLASSYSVGFFAGVSPFTARNWIVTGKFVLLVASFVMLPHFLYAPEESVPSFNINGSPPNLQQSVRQFLDIVAERPLQSVWIETRKIAFTLGITALGPAEGTFPSYFFLFTILFGVALWTGRMPWAIRNTLLVFTISHLVAITIASPWTYGYKTILPFHAALLLGIAFLLPNWGNVPSPVRTATRRELPSRPRISVVLPTYNEKDSIRGVIEDFFATGVVDEVVVINNNAAPGTSEEVAGTGAREVHEPIQGYGAACQRGLVEATGDYIVLCEPDGTFLASDIHKLLAYSHDFDIVYGSRTSQQFVWHGANMGFFLRFGNWAVAKYMELFFNGPNLTDVGCTMRLIKREVSDALAGRYRIQGSQFGPEMMLLTLRDRFRIVQIPVNYRPRVGQSSVTGDPKKALLLGMQMIWLITRHLLLDLNQSASTSPQARSATDAG
jgi:4-amino-4-deoxy-L-arabinose transferase-like glycosyltransferase